MIATTEQADNTAALEHPQAKVLAIVASLGLPLALSAALLVRLVMIVRAPDVLDGDESLVGIQAERIAADTAHSLPVFFYGQHYMGSLEAYLAAGLFRLFGPSVLLLRLVPLLFALALVALTYELGRRVVGRHAAIISAFLAAIPPLFIGVWSLKARGGYIETVTLGTGLLIVTHRILYGPGAPLGLSLPPPRRRWVESGLLLVWGLLAGLSLWTSPLSLYYVITAGGALVVSALRQRRWRLSRRDLRAGLVPAGLIGAGVLIGGLPLWIDNVYTRGATFAYLFSGSSSNDPLTDRVPRVAASLVDAVLPKLIGAWEPWGVHNTVLFGAISSVLYSLAGLYLGVRLIAGRRGVLGYRGRPRHGQGLLLSFAAVVAVLFCISGFGALALNPFGFDAASRYALPLASVLPVAVGALVWRLWRLWLPLGTIALAALLVVSLYDYASARPNDLFQSEYWSKLPPSEAPLAAFLEQHGIYDVWMNHWAGNPLIFQTNGRIAAADYNDVVVHKGINRLPWVMDRVAHDPHAAYVLVTREAHPPLEGLLSALHVRYAPAQRIGPYLVYWNLSRPVKPAEVAPGLDYPY